jgi:hypothetical protein
MSHSMAMDCDCPATRDAGLCLTSKDYQDWDQEISNRIEEVRIVDMILFLPWAPREIAGELPGSNPCAMARMLRQTHSIACCCSVSLQSLLEPLNPHAFMGFFVTAKSNLKIPCILLAPCGPGINVCRPGKEGKEP